MNDLTKILFQNISVWQYNESDNDRYDDGIKDDDILKKNHFLYAYLVDNKICYIGKSDRTPLERIRNGWAKNKSKLEKGKASTAGKLLAKAINKGEKVEIWLLFPEFPTIDVKTNYTDISGEEIKEAAKNGLLRMIEKKLIKKFKPNWNSNS